MVKNKFPSSAELTLRPVDFVSVIKHEVRDANPLCWPLVQNILFSVNTYFVNSTLNNFREIKITHPPLVQLRLITVLYETVRRCIINNTMLYCVFNAIKDLISIEYKYKASVINVNGKTSSLTSLIYNIQYLLTSIIGF